MTQAAHRRRRSSSLVVYVLVPWGIAASGRWDFYYTLTSVALLAIASARASGSPSTSAASTSGRAPTALVGGYVSAILVTTYGVSFWWTLLLAGLFCAGVSLLIGLPILRLRGVYFAMVTLVLTEVARLTALALPITNGASGITSIPLPGAHLDLRPDAGPRLRHPRQRQALLLPRRRHADGRSPTPASGGW